MLVKVVLHGAFKDRMPAGHKRPKQFYIDHVRDVMDALEQFFPIKEFTNTVNANILIGNSLSSAKALTIEQVAHGKIPEGATLHIVPHIEGNDPISGALITAAISIAASFAVSLLMSVLFPPPQNKNDKRKSALYENGLNTQEEGNPLPYLAGDRIFCGFNAIETAVDYTNSGGANTSGSGIRSAVEAKTGQQATSPIGKTGGGGTAVYDPGEGAYIAEVVTGDKGGGKTISNTTFSDATLRLLAAIGGGEIGGIVGSTPEEKEKNILINEVPLRDRGTNQRNFKGVSWTERRGLAGQTASPITPGVTTVFDQTIELKKQATQGGGQFYVTNVVTLPAVNRIKVRIRYNGLVQTSKKGNQSTTSVAVGCEVKLASAATWTPAGTWNVNEKSSDPFDRVFEVLAPSGAKDDTDPWMFRVFRITADSTDDKLQNDTQFRGWQEIQDIELAYDGSGGEVPTALFGCAVDLAQFDAGSFPEIALICEGQKVRVPDNYNPVARTYSGTWSGGWKYAVTSNPVWHWFELATNVRMGCGLPEDFFSRFSLYQTAQYCDQTVNGRPRFTVNKQFTDEKEGWQGLVEFAQSFRAVPFFTGQQVILMQDRPQTAVDHFINNAAVQNGLFAYKSTPIQDRINEMVVEYDNMDDYGRKGTVIYRDEDAIARNLANNLSNGGIVSRTVYKVGCTNKQEAYDFARILTFVSQKECETVEFQTLLAAAAYIPGQLIEIHDWNVSGLAPTGRIEAVTPTYARMDNAILLKADTSYQARVYLSDQGMTVRPLTMQAVDTLTTDMPFDTTGLEADTLISIVEVGAQAIQPRIFRILDIKEAGEGAYTVTAQLHVEGKYAWMDDNVPVPEIPWSQVNFNIPKPTGLKATNNSYVDDITGAHHEINLSWDAIDQLPVGENLGQQTPFNGYVVEVLRPYTSVWERIYQGHNTVCTMQDAEPGTYTFSVRAINILNRSGEAALLKHDFVYGEGEEGALLPPLFLGLD